MSNDKEQAKQAAVHENTVTGSDVRAAGSANRPEHVRSEDARRGTPEALDPRRDPDGVGAPTLDPRTAQAPGQTVHGQPQQNVEAARRQHNGGPGIDEQRGGEQRAHAVDSNQLRGQWREVQTMFVDDPRDAVTRADKLIEGGIQALVDSFAQRRQVLEQRWQHEKGSDTEELRQTLRGYRDLFDQLITASAGGATNI